ncbi:pyochelin biosynthetic protein [Streptomyces longisporoflavus]|uniref:thioesterase II family protein n=1 Tax=Streptomyces longisporoflavus TaxID=28044 RepID=UPI00167C78B0|nr:alpha/beta fold hydrolase [Streptomyces longisporoflavus]GGV68730.1 pyochelin biosynthetic protein [Streptomyces longisporoflavus]
MAVRNTTLVPLHRTPGARRTLVGLSFFGGGTAPYQSWAAALPAGTDLAVLCYPGREGRFAEPFARDWDELATDVTRTLREAASDDLGPYVLFGHSMSGWMAFDVAARLDGDAAHRPEALVLSSCNAPDRGLTDNERRPLPGDADERMLRWLETHGLLPPHVRENPGLTELALELMRADIAVRDTYAYDGAEVSVPLHVLTGADDPLISADVSARWRRLARGPHRHDVLGGGHFYTPEIWRTLPSRIAPLHATATGSAP